MCERLSRRERTSKMVYYVRLDFFFFQAEDGIRDYKVTGVQTCALPISHLFFWLLAILLFYIPQAAVVIYLNGRMPLEGGIYQWAKLGFNEFTGFIVA